MKNLKADYNEIVALYLYDEKFIYRLNSILYSLLGSPPSIPVDDYSKILKEEEYIYQKIQAYTTEEKRDLLAKIGHLLGGINER